MAKAHNIDYQTLKLLISARQALDSAIEAYEERAFPLAHVDRHLRRSKMMLKSAHKGVVLQPEYA